MTPDEANIRAERARQLLEDPMVVETFEAVEQALISAAKSAKTETEALKTCIAMQVFDLLKNSITSHIETAKVVQFNFKDKKKFGLL